MPIQPDENSSTGDAPKKTLKQKASGAGIHISICGADVDRAQAQANNGGFFEVSFIHGYDIF